MHTTRDIRQGTTPLPRISVITPTLNQGRYIEHTIQSVIAQGYPNFEHIVIDGGSTDDTLDILRKYPHLIWISEKDNGQADALNKGVARSSGDIIAWINSDDYYCPNAFHTIAMKFEMMPYAKIIVAQTLYLFESTMESFLSRNRELTFEDMIRYWDHCVPPTQPSVFFKTDVLNETGPFDTSLHYTMDFDMWLKMSLKHVFYSIPDVLAVYRFHDKSKSGFAQWSNFFPEYRAIYMRHKKHSAILPAGPLATIVIPFDHEKLRSSQYYVKEVQYVLSQLTWQKLHDIEVMVITDTEAAHTLLDLCNVPFPARIVNVPKLENISFYRAVTENAGGFIVHCLSVELAFDIQEFFTALTYLLMHQEIPIYTIPPYHVLPEGNPLATMGIAMPEASVFVRRDILKTYKRLEFPRYDAPMITFIVSVTEELSPLLYLSLFSIYEHCLDYSCEVRILTGKTHIADYIRSICNATVFENEADDNRFGVLNDIAGSATGRYLFFMTSNMVLTNTSVSEIMRTFLEHPEAGVVGSKTVYLTEIIDNAGCILLANGYRVKYGWSKPRQELNCAYLREVDFFLMAFFAIRGNVFKGVNGFSALEFGDLCGQATLQEADLCFKVRGLGFNVLYQPEAEVFDYHPYELTKDEGALKEYGLRDFMPFREKWHMQLKDNLCTFEASLIERASVSGNRPWVLLLCHRLPLVQSSEDGVGLLLRCFRDAGFNVAVHTEEVDPLREHRWLTRAGIKVFYNDLDFYEFTRDNVLHFDAVWLEDRSMALHRSTIIRRLSGGVLLIYNASAITSDEDVSGALPDETNYSNIQRIQIARDRIIATMVDVVCTCSDAYGKYLLALNQDLVVRLTPLTVDASLAMEVHTLIKTAFGRHRITGHTVGGFNEILGMENAIKDMAIVGLQDIVDKCGQRPLYIWGAGAGGIQTRRMLASMGVNAVAFLDKSPQKQASTVDGLPVYDPVVVLKTLTHKQRPYVVIGSIYGSAISADLVEMGYENEKDFAVNLLI
ncbi:MAG: glycosyltransferase [Nitrospirae bacterium]|uniref:glycosyltransferase n=1 Tax=Candidatus Magnetobacterium casense TaxID=1455061 RepID=UPI000698CFB8|nr:glycosyltransferase [Candidatus Magnetobacterium casensis]MBF0336980.1 glycosyltransferase [Nitrospirota bacterium]